MHHDHDPPKEGEAHIVEHEIVLLVGGSKFQPEQSSEFKNRKPTWILMLPWPHNARRPGSRRAFCADIPRRHQDLILSISKHLTKPCYPDQHTKECPPLSDYLLIMFLCMPRSAQRAGSWSCFCAAIACGVKKVTTSEDNVRFGS